MPQATVNGIELHYRDVGEGFPVVLVHGYTGNSRNWALTAPVLAERFRAISVDLRGHGLSAKPTAPEDYTLEAMAGDVGALLAHLGVRDCCLVGHSMGGMVVQALALSQPELARALVLVDTAAEAPRGKMWEERRAWRERMVQLAEEQGMEAVFDEMARATPMPPAFNDRPEYLKVWREQFLMTSREAYIHCARMMAERRPLLDELRRLTVPVLIVCGSEDEPFIEPSRRMHEAIAGSRLEVIQGAGHSPQMEAPREFNRVLLEFLSRVTETSPAR
jgi:3-oxoadipate enol-lactonase